MAEKGRRPALKTKAAATRAEVEATEKGAIAPKPETEPVVAHEEVAGIPVAVQTPEGEARESGAVPKGGDYGFIKGTVGADKQAVDTLVGPQKTSKRAWVVDHLDKDFGFQQHKVLLGFDNELAARRAYRSLYPDNPMGRISGVSTEKLKGWLATGDHTKPFSPIEKPALAERTPERAAEPQETSEAQVAPAREPAREEATPQPAPRKTLTLADRRAERQFVNEQKGRTRFADAAQPARAEDQTYTRAPDGTHSVETPGDGRTTAVDHPNGHDLVVRSTETARGDRGTGNGTARLERLSQIAHDRGGVLRSDARVSEPASRVYDRLKEKGWDVRTNAHAVDPGTGERRSTSELTPVHEVHPRDMAKLNGLQLKRLAHTGDTAARVEMERRLNGEPTGGAPEEGALAARRAEAQDNTPRLTKAQGEAAIKPLLDRLPGATGVTVHESADADTVPQHIKDALRPGSRNENAPAAYDVPSDTVHLFADRHSTPEQLQRKAVHEIVGHQGLRRLLGKDFDKVMDDIAKKADASGKAWMKEYAAEKELNLKDPAQAQVAADEWAAHLAEFPEDHPGAWQRIVDAVRTGLRKIPGLGRHMEWTENDVAALVRKSETGLRTFNPRVKRLQDNMGRLRFANADDASYERLPPDHPNAVAGKLGQLAAEKAN
jgi:hypothetical protein